MGGLLILAAIVVSGLLWADLTNRYVLVTLTVVVAYGIIGFVDDYRKVIRKDSKGLIARWKYFWQSVVALGVAFYLYSSATMSAETSLLVPFFKEVFPQLGIFFIIITTLPLWGPVMR